MVEKLTWKEIEARCHKQWVLIDNPKTDKNLNVLSGTLVISSPDREVIHRAAQKSKAKKIAVVFIGGPDKDAHFLL